MINLYLKFAVDLEDINAEEKLYPHGPLFHRWLPNGEQDSIKLNLQNPDCTLRIWFDRLGYVDDDGYIQFDYQKKEVDPDVVSKQGVLDAGPLRGMLEFQNLSEADLTFLIENKIGDENYIAFGKKIVKECLYPPIAGFLSVLKINYGQYWLRELGKWDSREMSLGSYCQRLNLKWSLDNGQNWFNFLPDEPIGYLEFNAIVDRPYQNLLMQTDWNELKNLLQTDYEASSAAFVFARAYELFDQGDLRYALIEGVTALEIAIDESVRQKLNKNEALLNEMRAFWNMPIISKMISLTFSLKEISSEDMGNAIEAIKIRNALVHEGKSLPNNAKVSIAGLLNMTARLLPVPIVKFPEARLGNALRSPEGWEKIYGKYQGNYGIWGTRTK